MCACVAPLCSYLQPQRLHPSYPHVHVLNGTLHNIASTTTDGTVKETIENMYRELLAGHADLLRRLETSRREVVLFGFCLGSCYAHAMARRLSRDHDLALT